MLQRKKFQIRTGDRARSRHQCRRRRPMLRRHDRRRPSLQRRNVLLRQIAQEKDSQLRLSSEPRPHQVAPHRPRPVHEHKRPT